MIDNEGGFLVKILDKSKNRRKDGITLIALVITIMEILQQKEVEQH